MLDRDLFYLKEERPDRNFRNIAIPLILGMIGFVGIILGAIGLLSGSAAKKEIAELRKASPGEAGHQGKVNSTVEERLYKISSEITQMKEQMRSAVRQTQDAFDSVSYEVKINREQIIRNSNQMYILADNNDAQLEPMKPPPTIEKVNIARIETPSLEIPTTIYHRKQGGDTINELARKYGKNRQEFLAANPGIDPHRLQIGQIIRIPK